MTVNHDEADQAKRGRILLVDDEVELVRALSEALGEKGFEVVGTTCGEEAMAKLSASEFDLMLSDLMMPGLDGIGLLRKALELDPNLVVILMTGQGSIPSAVEAMRSGAFDYVLKPFTLQAMLSALDRAIGVRRLRAENVRLRQHVARLQFESPRYQMVSASPAMRRVLGLIEKVAPTAATVLIRGESGTGKELVARALHHNSPRRDHPLVTINCAALQETLLESELFGHEKGSFTGAQKTKPGLVEVAQGGTLFIDEIAEMAPALQAKLLRVLEDKHYRRVGGTRELSADTRVIAATNKPLEQEQKAGRFREDLFYRLNVVTIELPPLRERREDIPALVEHLLATRRVAGHACRMHPAALQALEAYRWPGNVRELANVLERAQILADDDLITLNDLPDNIRKLPVACASAVGTDTLNLAQLECRAVKGAMEQAKGNKVNAAKLLGVSRRTLYRLIQTHSLEHSHTQDAATSP